MAIWRKSVIFQVSAYNYGKTRTKFENLKTPSCSEQHSGPIFVYNWNGYFSLLASVIKEHDVSAPSPVRSYTFGPFFRTLGTVIHSRGRKVLMFNYVSAPNLSSMENKIQIAW